MSRYELQLKVYLSMRLLQRNLFTKQCRGDLALSLVWEARDLYLNLQTELMCADCPWPYFVQTRTDSII